MITPDHHSSAKKISSWQLQNGQLLSLSPNKKGPEALASALRGVGGGGGGKMVVKAHFWSAKTTVYFQMKCSF